MTKIKNDTTAVTRSIMVASANKGKRDKGMDFKKLEEEFKAVGCDNMAIFFDWLSHYYTSTNAGSEQEYYSKVYGFLWGMSACGKISNEFRNSLVDRIIDDMKF